MVAYARCLGRDEHTAKDLASEAFTRTLQAVRNGSGPDGAWRPYLYAAVRNLAVDWARAEYRTAPTDDIAAFSTAIDRAGAGGGADVPAEAIVESEDHTMIVSAFRALPERQQTVLWHALIESEPREKIAAVLGTTPGNVNIMVFRARESLREAYLALHAATGCAGYSALLAHSVRRPHSRPPKRLREHLAECARCRAARAELSDLNRHLRAALLPAALLPLVLERTGIGLATTLPRGLTGKALGGKAAAAAGKAGLVQRLAELSTLATAVVGAGVVALVVSPIVITLNRPDHTPGRVRPTAAAPEVIVPASPRAPRTSAAASQSPSAESNAPARSTSPTATAIGLAERQAIQDGQPVITAANQGRAGHGLRQMRADPRLNLAAADQALEMVATGSFHLSVTAGQLASRIGYPSGSFVGFFGSEGSDPASVATSWFAKAQPGSVALKPGLRSIGAACAHANNGPVWCALLVGTA